LGFYILLSFGYPPLVSAFVSTALATVAETTIAPVLDELGVIRTDVANLILGPGVVDDVVEVAIASMTSVVISSAKSTMNLTFPALGFLAFGAFALIFSKFIVPLLRRTCFMVKENQFFLLMVSIALIFTTASQVAELGVLLGAIIAGIIFQRFVSSSSIADVEAKTLSLLRATAYGFLGPIFFFGIGFSVDLSSFGKCIQLTLLLLAANFLGKFIAAFITGKMIKLNMKAVAIIGLGLSSKFSMGIIPVQIFFSANVIDQQLFSSFIAVSAITTMIVPFSLSLIINRWRQSIT
jgi:Ca2+-transporting ATPase